MKRIALVAAMGGIAAALTAGNLAAQGMPGAGAPSDRLVRVGFGGGVTVPVSDASDAFESGINGEAYVLVTLGSFPQLRFNLGYQKFDLKSAVTTAESGSTKILSGVAGLSLDLIQSGPVRPYVTAGIGAFRVSSDFEGGGSAGDASSTEFGIDGGAGVAIRIGRLEGFVEARVQNVYTEAGLTDVSSLRTVPVTFGILF